MTAYALALTVEYEHNEGSEDMYDAPHGFAVIRLGAVTVHKEPMRNGSPWTVDRDDLERAAAGWLARLAGTEHEVTQ
jgi:hypothetical protein